MNNIMTSPGTRFGHYKRIHRYKFNHCVVLGGNNKRGNKIRPQCRWVEIIIQEKNSSIFGCRFSLFLDKKNMSSQQRPLEYCPMKIVRISSAYCMFGKNIYFLPHFYFFEKGLKTSLDGESNSTSSDVLIPVYRSFNEKDNDVAIILSQSNPIYSDLRLLFRWHFPRWLVTYLP